MSQQKPIAILKTSDEIKSVNLSPDEEILQRLLALEKAFNSQPSNTRVNVNVNLNKTVSFYEAKLIANIYSGFSIFPDCVFSLPSIGNYQLSNITGLRLNLTVDIRQEYTFFIKPDNTLTVPIYLQFGQYDYQYPLSAQSAVSELIDMYPFLYIPIGNLVIVPDPVALDVTFDFTKYQVTLNLNETIQNRTNINITPSFVYPDMSQNSNKLTLEQYNQILNQNNQLMFGIYGDTSAILGGGNANDIDFIQSLAGIMGWLISTNFSYFGLLS
jgi:hypothetical protein